MKNVFLYICSQIAARQIAFNIRAIFQALLLCTYTLPLSHRRNILYHIRTHGFNFLPQRRYSPASASTSLSVRLFQLLGLIRDP
jgi:hypothetical protein